MPCNVVGLGDHLVNPICAETAGEDDDEAEGEDTEEDQTLESWQANSYKRRQGKDVDDGVGDDC
jgi:hypothetical protein